MKTPDLLELATRNLRESKLRNSLTTIGISVGVASLVSMMSLGVGLQRMISVRLEKVGFNLLTVMNRGNLRMGAQGMDPSQANPADERALDEAARLEIERLPGVVEAYPDLRFVGEFSFGDVTRHSLVTGLPDSVKTTDDFNNVKGRYFSTPAAAEAIVDKYFAAELLGRSAPRPGRGMLKKSAPVALDVPSLAKDLVGKELVLNFSERLAGTDQTGGYSVVPRQSTVKIVGVADIDIQSRYARTGVFLPMKFAQELHVMQGADLRATAAPAYNLLIVRVKEAGQVQKVEDAVKKMGFGAFSIQDAMRSLRQGFAIFDIFLGVFGSLALAVASIGIVNTLVMAILERRREIGIMKAIGASDSDVKRVFFAEAGAMGVVGGVVGVLLGWLIGRVISVGTNIYLRSQGASNVEVWYVSWWLVAGAIGFALVVSLLAGWYPASRASRLDPVEALRYQ
jgi:ABC-type lipoprotein release transport system permease subunit